jgi:hypothetical protein
MFDDLFEEMEFGVRGPNRGQAIARVTFGVLGLLLGAVGVGFVLFSAKFAGVGPPLRAAMVALFAFVAAFSACNVALHKPWRWPARGLIASLVALFLVRLLFGA